MKRGAIGSALVLLAACSPSASPTGGPIKIDADPPLCEGCSPCDGGTSLDGGPCCRGCWDGDLCALLSNELTCGERGVICRQCLGGTICDAGSCSDASP